MYNIRLYQHIRLDTNEIFYIGIGGGTRPWDTRRSKFWKNIANKCGYRVDIIEDCLTWDQAKELEIMLIKFYGRRDLGLGPLVNLTDGGDGAVGYVHTLEARAKLSASSRGNTNMTGKNHTDATKAKISAIKTGKKHTPEHRAKISAANAGDKNAMFGKKGKKHTPEHIAKFKATCAAKIKKQIEIFDKDMSLTIICYGRNDAADKLKVSIGCISRLCTGKISHIYNKYYLVGAPYETRTYMKHF